MVALTKEQFEDLMADVPEEEFKELVPKLMDAFAQKNHYLLSVTQVAALTERLLAMSETIESQVNYIGELQQELQNKGKDEQPKVWTPPR